jgi:hypothetical protein
VTGDDLHSPHFRYVKVRGTIPGCKWQIADVRYVETASFSEKKEGYALATFIAESRELVPKLLQVIDRLREQRNRHPGDCIGRRIKLDAELTQILNKKETE